MANSDSYSVDHLGVDLWIAARDYEREMFERVRALGFEDISVADSEILVAIPKHGARITDVARTRRVTKQAAQERIKSLITRGYLVTQPDPGDKRARILVRSEKGHDLAVALAQVKRDLHAALTERLGEAEVKTLRAALRTISAALGEGPA